MDLGISLEKKVCQDDFMILFKNKLNHSFIKTPLDLKKYILNFFYFIYELLQVQSAHVPEVTSLSMQHKRRTLFSFWLRLSKKVFITLHHNLRPETNLNVLKGQCD